jgi:hypothetical protein
MIFDGKHITVVRSSQAGLNAGSDEDYNTYRSVGQVVSEFG